jgi:hypothetical protein
MAVFWDDAPCSLVVVYQHFRGTCCLWNISKLLPDYTVLQPRRQPSSYLPPWEPQILLRKVSSSLKIILSKKKLSSSRQSSILVQRLCCKVLSVPSRIVTVGIYVTRYSASYIAPWETSLKSLRAQLVSFLELFWNVVSTFQTVYSFECLLIPLSEMHWVSTNDLWHL